MKGKKKQKKAMERKRIAELESRVSKLENAVIGFIFREGRKENDTACL